VTRRTPRRALILALGSIALLAAVLCAADDRSAGGVAIPAAALRELAEMRRLTDCLAAPTADSGQELAFRGRHSIEIKGRERGDHASGAVRYLAVFDLEAARIVSYACYTNASTRTSGEAIVSLAEISSRGDTLARALFPGSNLGLESVKRHRTDGTESIYYEARYTSASGEFPFLEPPVQLLLNATTGGFFRLDIDPDWLAPPDPPRVRISRKASERIATVVLRGRDLAPAFGRGAVFGKVAPAEMFTVHPNENLGLFTGNAEARARVAWVVPFRVDGGDVAGLHNLFVDAATGRILGVALGQSTVQPAR
jgi:hypothetical protein